jgi:hypothetical protein
LLERSIVDQDVVRPAPRLLLRQLRRHAGASVGGVSSFALPAPEPLRLRRHHEEDAVALGLGAGLQKLGGLGHRDLGPAPLRLLEASRDLRAHQRVETRLEAPPLLRIGEDDAGDPRSVRPSFGVEHLVAEELAGRVGARPPGLIQLGDDLVGVEDRGAQLPQAIGHRRFSRGEPSGQPDAQHLVKSLSRHRSAKRQAPLEPRR